MKSGSWFLAAVALFIISFNSLAQVVEPDNARKIAGITLSELQKGEDAGTITGDSVIYDSINQPLLYIFTESKGGFIILSADKRTYPLLGWGDSQSSLTGAGGFPPSLMEMIDNWKAQIEFCREMNIKPSGEISEIWYRLENGENPGLFGAKDVLPLVATRWSQGCGYNAMCPVDASGPCGRALTGCVATAMAQVLRYREHPVTGVGSKCYTSSRYGELCATFSDGTYDYSAMSNTSGNTPVAKLMYHCGVSVSMNYGPSASSASSGSVATAMRNYFDYTNGLILSKGAYAEERWETILKRELDNNRPLYYSGYGTSGHAFVIDGYKETNHFHVNWGWGGSYDGYFYLSSLNPGSMSFTSGQQAIVGMMPTSGFTGLDFSSATILGCKIPVSGDLSTGIDCVNYYRNIYPATLGRELVYKFTTLLPGRIRIKITDQTQSVYTFLLDYACKDSLVSYGTNGVIVDNTSPGTYYVVIESTDGSEPTYTIEAICPTEDADLDIRSASVNPGFVQSLQTNVSLASTVKNIGITSSAECEMEYFFSEDPEYNAGDDSFLGSSPIPPLNPGNSAFINKVITMPDTLLPGSYYILFVADRANVVPESDDENIYKVNVTVPDSGILDCSVAVSLADSAWHRGNTLADGANNVEEYSSALEMTGPEVVHSFTPPYNGVARISFIEKSPGMLFAIILPVCNENTTERSLRIYSKTDTLVTDEFYVTAGVEYFAIIDGYKGASGDYGLLIDLPGECPEIKVEYWGKTDLCEGESWPGFWTYWGHSNYQWYRNGEVINGATNSSYTVSAPGSYHIEITENGCRGASVPVLVRSDSRPDTARISTGDTTIFCPGGSALLSLENTVSYPVIWARNDTLLDGATGNSFIAETTGSYALYTINGACRVKSENSIEVTVHDPPADIGDKLPFPSDKIRFFCTLDDDDYIGGIGENFMMAGYDYEPADDRFGNFWKARYLMGDDEMMYWSDYDTIPETFTIAFWFRTVTKEGGVLSGFFDNSWSPSNTDALLYMSDDGRLHLWMSNGGSPAELSTTGAYNDGKWHYVMIVHDGIMTIEVDEDSEKINSALAVTKQSFSGYWTFGGSSVPAGVSDIPSSVYYCGAIDDILCLDEANEFTTPYMIHLPHLAIALTEPAPECVPATVSFGLPFSQKGIEYRVWDRLRSVWAPVSAVGDGGDIWFGGAEVVIGTNEFQIVAKCLSTGCETVLDTVIVVDVWSVCTSLPENKASLVKVYPVPAKDNLTFETAIPVKEICIIDISGRVVHQSWPGNSKFSIYTGHLDQSVYLYQIDTEDGLRVTGRIIVLK